MKPKILILTPVYNDWENLIKLLNKIIKDSFIIIDFFDQLFEH